MDEGSEALPFEHLPVMAAEVTDLLAAVPPGLVVDATVGGGGHARALLTARPDLRLLGIDRDPVAVAAAGAALEPFGDRVRIVQGGFEQSPKSSAVPTSWETRESWRSCSTSGSAARSSTVRCGASRTGPTRRRSTCGWTACRR